MKHSLLGVLYTHAILNSLFEHVEDMENASLTQRKVQTSNTSMQNADGQYYIVTNTTTVDSGKNFFSSYGPKFQDPTIYLSNQMTIRSILPF